jgi:hypothetical protein
MRPGRLHGAPAMRAPGAFTLGPTGDMLADLRREYERMAGMIIGAVPEFDE